MTDAPRWWQWPTILSLDAPAVGVLWQLLLAKVAAVPLRWPHLVVLAATVWLAYVADRWIEGWHLHWRDIRTQRHHFYQRWRWPVAAVWVVVCIADIAVAFTQLSWREITAGFLLMLPVLLYLLSHQLLHRHRQWRAPKEMCVAALLTGGVCVFLVPTARPDDLAASSSLFALLCFANCALISMWEREVDLAHGQTSLVIDPAAANDIGWAIRQLPWLIAVLAAVAWVGAPGASRDVGVSVLASALLLAVVDRFEHRIGWMAARVLADVALLTPVVPLLRGW